MSTTRCDWSDLPTTQCGHCQNIGPTIGRINPPAPRPKYPDGTRPAWTPAHDRNRVEPRDWNDGDRAPTKASPCRHEKAWTEERGWSYFLRSHLPTCTESACPGCEPCTNDYAGNPVQHCRARQSCSEHLDHAHPRTCPRCIAVVRANLTQIERLTGLMLEQAIFTGLDSPAAMIAGPAADPAACQARGLELAEAAHGITDPRHPAVRALIEFHEINLDEAHPAYLLAQWERMIRTAMRHREPPGQTTLSTSISYLSWVLTDMAQDPDQDFAEFAREIADCRGYLEGVLRASRMSERGAPCPLCDTPRPQLFRRLSHWCEDPDCTREHDSTGARDTWVCPKNPAHWWKEADYRNRIGWDALEHAEHLTSAQMEEVHGVKPGTLRWWVHEGKVERRGKDKSGRLLYDVAQVKALLNRDQDVEETAS